MKITECITKDQLVDHYLIRKIVFIDEQKVSYEDEFDLDEKTRIPFVVYKDNKPIATARIFLANDYSKIERVAVLKEYRHLGIGSLIMNHLCNYSLSHNLKLIKIGAQISALRFYEKLGFEKYGDEYLDANIPHYNMRKALK